MPTRNVVRVPRHAIGSNGVVKGAVLFPTLASVPSSDELAASGIKLGITTTAKAKDSPSATDLIIARGDGDGGGSVTAALPNKEGVVHNDENNAVVVVISEAASDTSSSAAADHHAVLKNNFDSARHHLETKDVKSINTDNAADGGGSGENTMNQTLSAVEKMSVGQVSCDQKRDHPPTAISNNVAEGEETTLPNNCVRGHPILDRHNVTPIRGGSFAGGSLPPKRDDDVAEVTSAAAAESRRKRFMMNADSRSENNTKKTRTENTQDTSSNHKPHRSGDGIIIPPPPPSPYLPPNYTINPKSEAFDITIDPYAHIKVKGYQQTPLKSKYLSNESVGITARDIFEEEQAAKAAAKGKTMPVAPVNVHMIPCNAAASMATGMIPSLAQPNPPKQQNQAMATAMESIPIEKQPMPQQTQQQQVTQQVTQQVPPQAPPQMPQPTQQQAPQQMPQQMHQQFPQGQAYWPGMPMPGMMGVQSGMQAMGGVPGGGMGGVPPPKQQNQAMATSTASKPSEKQPMPQPTQQQQATQQVTQQVPQQAPPQMPQPTQQQAPQQMPQQMHQQFPQGQAYWPGMPMPGMMGVQSGMQAMGVVPGAGENGVKPGMPGGGYPMIPMHGIFPHHHMGPQPFGMFPAPCVPFQPMPGQPSSNVAQPPPTQPSESQLPSREETLEEERRRKMKEAIKECTMRPFFGSTAPSTDDTTPSSATTTTTEPNSPKSPVPALSTIKKNTMLSQI